MNKKKKENNINTKNKKKGKAANTKLSRSDRDRIVNSGSAKEVAKYKDRLSTRELETAVNRLQQEKIKRIDLEKKLDSINTPEKKRAITLEKIDKYASSLEKASNSIEKAAKFYNTAAKVHNTMSPATDQWPIFGEKKAPGKNKELEERGKRWNEYKLRTSELEAEQKRREIEDKTADYIRERQRITEQQKEEDRQRRARRNY